MKILIVMNWHRDRGGADRVAERHATLLEESGIDVYAFYKDSRDIPQTLPGKFKAAINGIYPKKTLRDFQDTLEQIKPDIVHAHEVYPLISPWIFKICRKKNIPCFFHCHDFLLTCPSRHHWRNGENWTACYKKNMACGLLSNPRGNWPESLAYITWRIIAKQFRLFEKTNGLVVPSTFLKNWLVNAGWLASKIHVIANPISDKIDASPNEDYIAYAGRISEEKGFDLFIRCIEKTNLPYKIAGTNDHPNGVGVLNEEEMRGFLKKARFLVTPSLCMETFGLSAAEAMLQGTPVIASELGAFPELIEDGSNGLLFEAGDINELIEKINHLWTNPAEAEAMGQRAQEKIRSHYTEKHFMERILSLYQTFV